MASYLERFYSSPSYVRGQQSQSIDVPRNEQSKETSNSIANDENNTLSSTYRSPSAFGHLISPRPRKPSISFDSNVKLEDGGSFYTYHGSSRNRHPAASQQGSVVEDKEELSFKKVPVKSGAGNLSSSLGLRGNSSLSSTEQGEIGRPIQQQPTNDNSHIDRLGSLTSESTLSPPVDEVRTPPLGLWGHFPNAGDNSESNLVRNRSERSFRRRRPRRTLTDKSTHSVESGVSAISLLSSWGTPIDVSQKETSGEEIGDYVIGREIGHGGLSTVKEAVTIKDGLELKVAVKIVHKKIPDREEAESDQVQAIFEHEIDVWRCVKHRYILPLIEVYHTPMATYCFMEYMPNGTLRDLLKKNREGFPAAIAQKFTYQIASALRYLHEDVRVIHRDIKLENCLLKPDLENEGELVIQLCDFGLSQYIIGSVEDDNPSAPYDSKPGICSRSASVSFTGSLHYASPELADSSNPNVTPAVDVWALGCTMYAMHTGVLPFYGDFFPAVHAQVTQGIWDADFFRLSKFYRENGELGVEGLEATTGCLTKDVDERWTIRQLLESRYLRELAEAGGDI